VPEFISFEIDEGLKTAVLHMKEDNGFEQNVWTTVSDKTLNED